MKLWRVETCVVIACLGCGSADDGTPGAAGGAPPVAQGAELLPGWQPGDPCDPRTDGWKPEPIPVSPEVQKQIDEGKPVAVPFPSDYQAEPPPGVPECRPYGDGTQGTLHAFCNSTADYAVRASTSAVTMRA